jgi:hypothetical protein
VVILGMGVETEEVVVMSGGKETAQVGAAPTTFRLTAGHSAGELLSQASRDIF